MIPPHSHPTSIKAVPAAAAGVSLLLPPAALSPQQLHELDGVVQQQRAAGDERDAADYNAGGFHAGGRVLARRREASDDHGHLRDDDIVEQEKLGAGYGDRRCLHGAHHQASDELIEGEDC